MNEKPRAWRGWGRGPEGDYARESSDNPILNAFCRVAPSVRCSDFAIFPAGVLRLAIVLRVRTCAELQAILLRFLGIWCPFRFRHTVFKKEWCAG